VIGTENWSRKHVERAETVKLIFCPFLLSGLILGARTREEGPECDGVPEPVFWFCGA
jgi:hypothetical protein